MKGTREEWGRVEEALNRLIDACRGQRRAPRPGGRGRPVTVKYDRLAEIAWVVDLVIAATGYGLGRGYPSETERSVGACEIAAWLLSRPKIIGHNWSAFTERQRAALNHWPLIFWLMTEGRPLYLSAASVRLASQRYRSLRRSMGLPVYARGERFRETMWPGDFKGGQKQI
jgi:hypothetical protein